MRALVATFAVAVLSSLLLVPVAVAAPTAVNLRIEGRAETLFEGPILAEPDAVRASSDTEIRRCNGLDVLDPQNVVPEPTSTSISADAMALLGETFDGKWYPGFEDYFVTRFGPDEQDVAENAYWGILVNNVFTNVGGCQYQLHDGDESLWIWDAFKHKPILALFSPDAPYTTGTRPLTATVALGEPFPVEVASYEDNEEDEPPATPSRAGSTPFAGADVSPVVTTAKGFERVNAKSTATVVTNSEGKQSITFAKPGWHRIKATVLSGGVETAIRSNRIDVCVTGGEASELEKPLEGASTCDEVPAADKVRTASPIYGDIVPGPGAASTAPAPVPSPPAPTTSVAALRIGAAKLDRKQLAKGKLGVSWKVLEAGSGVKSWAVSSLTVGQKKAHWVTRARGTAKTTATLALPKGHAYKLRLAVTGKDGKVTTLSLGTAKVPGGSRHPR
jgi:hypothetical protein